jgi:hypothetical protein
MVDASMAKLLSYDRGIDPEIPSESHKIDDFNR